MLDMADIPLPRPGMPDPVEYAELAVATYSNLLMIHPLGPGTAAPAIAQRMAHLMEPTDIVTRLGPFRAPLRAPHHSTTPKGLIGELWAARGGILYLAEVDEFIYNRAFARDLQAVMHDSNRPLIVASINDHPASKVKMSARIQGLEERGLRFPLQVRVDLMNRTFQGNWATPVGRGPGWWSSEAISARIASYDPDARAIAHDLVEEGRIDDAWKVLRGEVVERINPAGGPARTGRDVIRLFRQTILEPGVEAISIAQDILEENSLTLLDMGRPGETKGEFTVSSSPAAVVRWKVARNEYSRMVEASWSIHYDGNTWEDERSGWVGARHPGGYLDEAIYRALEHAWHIVKVMKRVGMNVPWQEMQAEIEGRGMVTMPLTEQPRTPPWLISPYGEHRRGLSDNPPGATGPTPHPRSTSVEQIRAILANRKTRCTAGCPGWYVFDTEGTPGHENLEIQACDECNAIAQQTGEAGTPVVSDRQVARLPEAQAQLAADLATLQEGPQDNPGGGAMSVNPRALRMYRGFHKHDWKKIGDFHPSLRIPETVKLLGDAKFVLYKSDKLNPETHADEGWIDYIHEHEKGVRIFRVGDRAPGDAVKVPAWLRKQTDLVYLGDCNGFAYYDDDGAEREVKGTKPYPELYTTPNGKALLVIQGKRTLLAMFWGGRLGVEPRGIVH